MKASIQLICIQILNKASEISSYMPQHSEVDPNKINQSSFCLFKYGREYHNKQELARSLIKGTTNVGWNNWVIECEFEACSMILKLIVAQNKQKGKPQTQNKLCKSFTPNFIRLSESKIQDRKGFYNKQVI